MPRGYPDDWDARRRLVYQRDDHTCRNCGRSAPGVELHAHHVVPKSRGGTHRLENLVTLCDDCHKAVHSKHRVAPTAGREDAGGGLLVQLYSAWRLYKRLSRLF